MADQAVHDPTRIALPFCRSARKSSASHHTTSVTLQPGTFLIMPDVCNPDATVLQYGLAAVVFREPKRSASRMDLEAQGRSGKEVHWLMCCPQRGVMRRKIWPEFVLRQREHGVQLLCMRLLQCSLNSNILWSMHATARCYP